MTIYDECYDKDANHGLKINDVVQTKCNSLFWGILIGTDYIIDYICNGLVSMKDPKGVLRLGNANNLICVGHVEKCIQFKDKTLCLI